jgi:hypothetical protein
MNLSELIEQLELIKQDHPRSAHLNVKVWDEDVVGVYAVNLRRDEIEEYVEIECCDPYALP